MDLRQSRARECHDPPRRAPSTAHRRRRTRQLVGTCLLTNLHLSRDPVLICVEALVHEAIHQHLYRIELANGPFCDLDDAGRYRSPWSGNRIPLHSLIHASLVWFGVLSLWCQLARSCTNEDEALSVRGRVAPTLFGFAFIRQIVDSPTFPRASVAPQIVELIGHIAKIATAAQPPVRWARSAIGRLPAGEREGRMGRAASFRVWSASSAAGTRDPRGRASRPSVPRHGEFVRNRRPN